MVDLCLGLLISYLIYKVRSTRLVSTFSHIASSVDLLKNTVEELMGLPWGFKPNKELDNFLGTFLINLLEGWKTMTAFLIFNFGRWFIQSVAVMGVFGGSLQLAMVHDVILYLTSHV
jgi:hypothetical protein